MSYDEQLTLILRMVRTRQDQVKLLEQLGQLDQSQYKTGDQGFDYALKSVVSLELAGIISEMLKEGISIKDLLQKIIDAVKNLQTLKLTIAVNPSEKMIDEIHHWMDQNLPAGIILEIEVDKKIIGGAKISWGGKYGDFSAISKWENFWKSADLAKIIGDKHDQK
jgi:F0F1-type ATP synthase delta subunit